MSGLFKTAVLGLCRLVAWSLSKGAAKRSLVHLVSINFRRATSHYLRDTARTPGAVYYARTGVSDIV